MVKCPRCKGSKMDPDYHHLCRCCKAQGTMTKERKERIIKIGRDLKERMKREL